MIVAIMHIKGKTQARIIFTKIGLVSIPLSRIKQSTERIICELWAMIEMTFRNYFTLSSQDKS